MRKIGVPVMAMLSVMSLMAGCVSSTTEEVAQADDPIVFATYECCEVLDPANTYSSADWPFMQQIYSSILNVNPETGAIEPELAESAGFVTPNRYRVVMKEGLKFTNGNALSASDAVHSLTRLLIIDSPNGPQNLLDNVASIELLDENTFEIELLLENDNTIENVLASMIGLVVDEEVFPSDEVLGNEQIIEANSYSGPYVVTAFEEGSLMALSPNPEYQGVWGKPSNSGVIIRSYQDLNNLAAGLESGELDLAIGYRSTVLPQLIEIGAKPGFKLIPGPTTEGVYLWLSHRNLPFGSSAASPDSSKAMKVRQAIELLIDRKEINEYAYYNTYLEMPTAVPADITISAASQADGAAPEELSERLEVARSLISSVGLEIPVRLELLTSESRWGDLSVRLSTIVKEQLERSSLFEISITSLEWSEFRERRREGTFELSLQMWGHDFADPDNYLTPLVTTDSWVNNGYSSPTIDQLVRQQASAPNDEAREAALSEIQIILQEDLPFIPLLSGGPFVIAREDLLGTAGFVDSNWKLIFPILSKK